MATNIMEMAVVASTWIHSAMDTLLTYQQQQPQSPTSLASSSSSSLSPSTSAPYALAPPAPASTTPTVDVMDQGWNMLYSPDHFTTMATSISDIQLHVLTFGRGILWMFLLLSFTSTLLLLLTTFLCRLVLMPIPCWLMHLRATYSQSQSRSHSHSHRNRQGHGYENGDDERIRAPDSQSHASPPARKMYMRKLDKLQLLERAAPERLQQDLSSIPCHSNLSRESRDQVPDQGRDQTCTCCCTHPSPSTSASAPASPSTCIPTRTSTCKCASTAASSRALCVICLDDLKPGTWTRTLHCKHTFHASCVQQWFEMVNRCPLCQRCIVAETVYRYRN